MVALCAHHQPQRRKPQRNGQRKIFSHAALQKISHIYPSLTSMNGKARGSFSWTVPPSYAWKPTKGGGYGTDSSPARKVAKVGEKQTNHWGELYDALAALLKCTA